MKVGIFDPYLDTLGGGEKYMLTAASCLSKENDVYLFWDGKKIATDAKNRFGLDLSGVSFTKNIFASNVSIWERVFESMKYDRIFYLSDGSIPVVFPKKLFLHFQFPVEWIDGKSIPNKLKIHHVSEVICNSEFTKEHIDKAFEINSKVLYPPSSGEFTNIKAVKKENIILTVGRFNKLDNNTTFKKHEFIIESFKKMVDLGLKNWNLILVISFKNEEKKELDYLKKMIGKYPIKILENVDNQKLMLLYKSSKIYWHAAGFGEDVVTRPEMVEHFGIATVQAMEQGCVPIVLNAGGQKEIVMNGINGFLWTKEEELLEKTEEVIKKNSLWEKLSKEAVKRAVFFSKDTFCQKLQNIFQ